jgi:hypothetical protein
MRKFSYKFVEKIKPHDLRLINFSRNRAVCMIMWKIMLSRKGTARFACCIIKVTHTNTHTRTHTPSDYITLNGFPRQHWLRERTTVLRYTYSACTVPCYVRLLCTSTVCSVYRVPSVIMCSSALILPSFCGNCSAV